MEGWKGAVRKDSSLAVGEMHRRRKNIEYNMDDGIVSEIKAQHLLDQDKRPSFSSNCREQRFEKPRARDKRVDDGTAL